MENDLAMRRLKRFVPSVLETDDSLCDASTVPNHNWSRRGNKEECVIFKIILISK